MPEAQNRRAIILIPGLQRVERFARRDLLIENLQLLERRPMQPGAPVAVLGEAGRRLLPLPLRGAASLGPELDLFEAYWADMVTPPAELGPFGRLWSGFELILYWLFSKGNLRAIGLSPTIAIGLMAGGVLLLLWYACSPCWWPRHFAPTRCRASSSPTFRCFEPCSNGFSRPRPGSRRPRLMPL